MLLKDSLILALHTYRYMYLNIPSVSELEASSDDRFSKSVRRTFGLVRFQRGVSSFWSIFGLLTTFCAQQRRQGLQDWMACDTSQICTRNWQECTTSVQEVQLKWTESLDEHNIDVVDSLRFS